MASSFTTILIEHYEQSFPSARDPHVVEAMLGTFQDIPPIIVAVLGGFLQQVTSRPPTFCNDNLISNSRHSTSIITTSAGTIETMKPEYRKSVGWFYKLDNFPSF